MFSIFKKNKIDISSPLKFKESILAKAVTTSELLKPSVLQSWMKKENAREYVEVLEELALKGNVASQEFSAQFFVMTANRTTNKDAQRVMYHKALKFAVLAAESGVAREAMNIPISALKLAGILTDKNGQEMDEEIESLIHLAYKWHCLNSKNQGLAAADRKRSAQQALELQKAWPGLHEEQEVRS